MGVSPWINSSRTIRRRSDGERENHGCKAVGIYMMLTPETRFYLFLTALLLVAAGIIWFDWTVLFKDIVRKSDQVVMFRQETEYLRARMQYLPVIKNEASRAAKERKTLQALHSFANPLEFLYFLEESAQSSGNQIHVVVQEGKEQTFAVELTGSFNGLLDFLTHLQVASTNVELKQVVKTKSPEGSAALKTELSVIP